MSLYLYKLKKQITSNNVNITLEKSKVMFLLYKVSKLNYLLSLIAACAAASLAIGTRKGEHDT